MASFTIPPPPLEDHPDTDAPVSSAYAPQVRFIAPPEGRSAINRPRAHSSVTSRSRSKSSGAALIRSLLKEGAEDKDPNYAHWGAVNSNLSDYEEVRKKSRQGQG